MVNNDKTPWNVFWLQLLIITLCIYNPQVGNIRVISLGHEKLRRLYGGYYNCIILWSGTQSIPSVRENLLICLENISAYRRRRELRCFLFGRPWVGESFNPFISTTTSKPLISSRSWLTLYNCEIYYLSAVNYDIATTDQNFVRARREGLFWYYLLAIFPHNNSRGHLPGGLGGGYLLLIFQPMYAILYFGHTLFFVRLVGCVL
jgi:hypothetical protein